MPIAGWIRVPVDEAAIEDGVQADQWGVSSGGGWMKWRKLGRRSRLRVAVEVVNGGDGVGHDDAEEGEGGGEDGGGGDGEDERSEEGGRPDEALAVWSEAGGEVEGGSGGGGDEEAEASLL